IIETDDQISALQLRDELVHLLLAVDFVSALAGVVGDGDAQAHETDFVPATDFVSGFLGFEIEIDNVLPARRAHGADILAGKFADAKEKRAGRVTRPDWSGRPGEPANEPNRSARVPLVR